MVDLAGLNFDLQLLEKIIQGFLIVFFGYVLAKFLSSITESVIGRKVNPHIAQISKKGMFYTLMSIAVVTAIGLFIEITTIIAAAGIAGIAIGMAAQRSVSNIISGLFLLADQPFEIGDAVDIGGSVGVILDISLLSTRLRTFDNKYMRLPNDAVANAKIINLSYYDIRRLDVPVGIAYKDELSKAVEIINEVVSNHALVLAEPEPTVLVTGFGDSSIDVTARLWVQRAELFSARTELIKDIKTALDKAGIEIPFPHRTVYLGTGEHELLGKAKK